MVKKHAIKNLIILFICLFTFAKCDGLDWLYYDFSTNSVKRNIKKGDRIQNYAVTFEGEDGKGDISKIPFYFKIEVTSDDDNPAPTICFSTTDQNCRAREQLVKNPSGKTAVMWLRREEFNKDEDEFYIHIECSKEECDYTLSVVGDQYPTFGPNFVYSYLVGAYNKEMRFVIQNKETNVYMVIALEGSSKATLNVDNMYQEGVKYKTGQVLHFFIQSIADEKNMASISVRGADQGEYLTLSVHLVNNTVMYEGLAPTDFLQVNGPEITGYLEKNVMNEECFPIDLSDDKYNSYNTLYVTGRIHTKYAWFFLEDARRNYLEETDTEILDGHLSFAMKNNKEVNYICFELPSESTFEQYKMAFSFTVTNPTNLHEIYNYYPPQITGEIYRRMIPKGHVAFFSGTKNDNSAKKYDYSLFRRKGLTKMYIDDCRNYPFCNKEVSSLDQLKSPKETNKMTIFTTDQDKSSALGSEKFVIIAYCEDDDNDNNGYCEFETSIISKSQDIYLVEDEKFSKYVISQEKGKFIIDLQSGRQIQRITVDIMIYSGDVTFDCHNKYQVSSNLNDEQIQISYDKYYLSNKIYFHINLAQLSAEQIIVDYSAVLNSFFTIQYSVHSYNLEQLEEKVYSGESYLVQIDPTSASKTKKILLANQFYKNENPFLANFFELNCEFEVIRGEDPVTFFDGYAQEILDSKSSEYKSEFYEYNIKINETDLSNYNHKMCMLYVAGYEAETKNDREIIVGENINQQVIFEDNFKKIRFLYPHADAYKDLAVHINVIDKAFYNVRFYANNKNIRDGIVTRTQTFFIKGSVLINSCDENTICPVVVEAELDTKIVDTDPMLEVTIREILNTPTYLQKGQAKLDFVCGDRFYYLYTDIGKNEIGEITINFLREFGNIWAKVVRKDQTTPDEEANWRGIYRMPSADWEDSLPYDAYTKKLTVNPEETADCIEGCYLLISVQVSQIGEYVEDDKFYPFSILTRITPNNRAYTDIPKVVIQADEFIIGSVDVADNERIYEFFQIWLPHDSDLVEFDWQSSVAGLYINLGNTRPTTKNAHFKLLPPGKDTVLNITKQAILAKAKEAKVRIPNDNSLQDISLVIGVWTDKSDSINTELYSLRVHQPQFNSKDPLDIVLVNTDQKIMCNPKEISATEYRCLFVVTYDDDDVNNYTPLLAYGVSINHRALSFMYGNYIDRNIYDQYDVNELTKKIPTSQTSDLNARADGVDYLYTNRLIKSKYVFINVMTDKPDPIMIITNMPIFNYVTYDLFEFYPNPTTEQLINVPGDILRLAFPGSNSIMVDIVTLYGHAEISWKSDPETKFVLRGVGDRISLYSGKEIDELVVHRLVTDNQANNLSAMPNPGFVFYIQYHLVNPENEISYEEINYGKSLEIAYKDTNLPVILYSKIGTEYRDINVAITFKNDEIESRGENPYSPLLISAQLVKEKTIYDAKKDKDISPSSERAIRGNYDAAIKTAQVFLSEEKIKSFNVKASDNPSLYIRIEQVDPASKVYDKFSLEAQVSGVNDGVIPVEKVYHYGRVRNSQQSSFYRLKVDKSKPLMRVQIAFNSDNLDFCIRDTEGYQRTNITFKSTEKARGKVYVTINVNTNKELYFLYIYKKTQDTTNELLNNYAFKYINAKDESELIDYKISGSPKIEVSEYPEQDLDVIQCTFNKLDIEPGKANVTYFFKVVENSTHVYKEEINTIAVTESPAYTIFERNPLDDSGKITIIASGYISNWCYLNVIAQVQQNNILEYVAYEGKVQVRPNKDGSKSTKDNSVLFFVVGGILLMIVAALIVIIFIFQQRNKNLLNQVKHVSFQQTNSSNNVDPNLLLQKSQPKPE